MATPTTINGFTILPITYSSSATHYLYLRQHTGSKKKNSLSKNFPEGRTLFLVNVPPDATDRELTLLFKHCGTVERVLFDIDSEELQEEIKDGSDDEDQDGDVEMEGDGNSDDAQPRKRRKVTKIEAAPPKVVPLPSTNLRFLRPTGRTAHLIFLDQSSLEKSISSPQNPRPWPTTSDPPAPGLVRYQSLYAALRPPLDTIREHADSYMEFFEYEQAKNKQKSKYRKGEAIVDEDGFTLVTRGGAYGQTLGGGVAVASKKFQATGETTTTGRKKPTKEKTNFYAYQKAEKQRKGICVSRCCRARVVLIYLSLLQSCST